MQRSPLYIVAILGSLVLTGGVGVIYVRAGENAGQGREAMVDQHFDGKWLSSGLYEDFFGERFVELHLVEDEEFILRWFVRAGDRVGLIDAWVLQKMAAGTFDSETGRLEPHEFYLYALDDRELKPREVPEGWRMTISIRGIYLTAPPTAACGGSANRTGRARPAPPAGPGDRRACPETPTCGG